MYELKILGLAFLIAAVLVGGILGLGYYINPPPAAIYLEGKYD